MLTNERINEIKQKIIDNKLYDKSLNQIARENDIEVVFADLSLVSENVSWAIWKIDWKYRIYISSKDNINRQRFTFAHELWHYFLEHINEENYILEDKWDYLFRSIYDGITEWQRKIEEEANEFAGNWLVPEDKLKEAINLVWVNITILSEYFKVSKWAMKYRLYKLHYLESYE